MKQNLSTQHVYEINQQMNSCENKHAFHYLCGRLLALHTSISHLRFNQLQIKNIFKNPRKFQKGKFEFAMHQTLWWIQLNEVMGKHTLLLPICKKVPFYIRYLSIHRLWHGMWNRGAGNQSTRKSQGMTVICVK